jgi:2-desacetyl-2-hydroxyethyl bacteriochlorophyllide A dehydrogenase
VLNLELGLPRVIREIMTNMMDAIQITALGHPVEQVRIPIPAVGSYDVLVRVGAAGICHSDEHYRSGSAPPGHLPITPGHEVAGTIESVGEGVKPSRVGERVALHYLITCGRCVACSRGDEQFCKEATMIGKYVDGGWAEYVSVPSRNAVALPDTVDLPSGAVMMCSSATSYHALKKARVSSGERVAVFGLGGLGQSAVQLALVMGAAEVFAVDINPERLARAASYGAVPVDAAKEDPVAQIREATHGDGVDAALELIGLRLTIEQAAACLAPKGRAAIAGICPEPISIDTYHALVGREAELIGVSDHLLSELYELMDLCDRLRFDQIITDTIPLDAPRVNAVLERLGAHGEGVRTVIEPL